MNATVTKLSAIPAGFGYCEPGDEATLGHLAAEGWSVITSTREKDRTKAVLLSDDETEIYLVTLPDPTYPLKPGGGFYGGLDFGREELVAIAVEAVRLQMSR
jgi:hypothetical protein